MKIDITKATVVVRKNSTDVVYLDTELQSPTYPFTENASLTIHAANGTGVDWVKKHFPCIEINTVVV